VAGLGTVTTALDGAGLLVEATYSLFPDVGSAALAVWGPDDPTTAALVARITARHYAGRRTLADPYRTGYDVVRAGHGTALAPGLWFAGRCSGSIRTARPTLRRPRPSGGELVEELLLAAIRAGDQQVLRRTVQAYVDWLLGTDHATAADAVADNVVIDGRSYTLLDTGSDAAGGSYAELVVRHLARFVTRAWRPAVAGRGRSAPRHGRRRPGWPRWPGSPSTARWGRPSGSPTSRSDRKGTPSS
jgi:hypothetical protein